MTTTRPASVVALEALNVAICAAALVRAGLPAETELATAPRAYVEAYSAEMCERRAEVFSAIEAAGKDASGMSRHFVEGMACAFARATAPRVATDGAGYQRTDIEPVEAAPVANCYVESRTRAGILIRRHGPFVRDSADEASAYHAEECAAIGWNRGRRHDDPRTMRVRRFSDAFPAPVAMVAQPVQQAQAQHTPGPWSVWEPDGVFVQSEGRDICLMTPTSQDLNDGDDEDTANAHVIAAAPDMLAALHTAASALGATLNARGYRTGSCVDDWSAEVRGEVAALASVRAAIAKASV